MTVELENRISNSTVASFDHASKSGKGRPRARPSAEAYLNISTPDKWLRFRRIGFHLQRFYYQEAFLAILSLRLISFGICSPNLLSMLSVSV
jgi:hypothetical protein